MILSSASVPLCFDGRLLPPSPPAVPHPLCHPAEVPLHDISPRTSAPPSVGGPKAGPRAPPPWVPDTLDQWRPPQPQPATRTASPRVPTLETSTCGQSQTRPRWRQAKSRFSRRPSAPPAGGSWSTREQASAPQRESETFAAPTGCGRRRRRTRRGGCRRGRRGWILRGSRGPLYLTATAPTAGATAPAGEVTLCRRYTCRWQG